MFEPDLTERAAEREAPVSCGSHMTLHGFIIDPGT